MSDTEKLLEKFEAKIILTIQTTESKIMNNINETFKKFDERLVALETKSKTNTDVAVAAHDLAKKVEQELFDLRAEMATLKESNTLLTESNTKLVSDNAQLNDTVSKQAIKLHVHSLRSENAANRGLRKTVEIRGIPEPEEEKTWDETREVAANAIANATGMDPNAVGDMFERIHRGKKYAGPEPAKYPRKIFATMHNWNHIEVLRKALRTDGRDSNIFVDRMYGPDTTYRQKLAIKKRQALKNSKTIISGYVDFPAKLFVKYGQNSKYVLCEDFSDVPIPDDVYNKFQ